MMPALHIFALVAGFYLYCLTYVMRKSNEGRWINRIEELWIRIDDRSKSVGETTKALFGAVAGKVTQTLNRIVGINILSPRLVGLSGCLSFTSLFLFYGLFFELGSYFILTHSDLVIRSSSSGAAAVRSVPLLIVFGVICLLLSEVFATLAILPIKSKALIWAWLSCAPTFLVLLLFIRLVYRHQASGPKLTLFEAFAISLASDVVFLIIIRQSLKWMLSRTTILRTIITIAIQLLLLGAVFILPIQATINEANAGRKGSLAVSMLMLGLFNIPTALASASFVFLLFIVLLHRLVWPLLSQLTYILTRNDVLDKRNAVRAVALGLIIWGLGGLAGPPLLVKVLEKILG